MRINIPITEDIDRYLDKFGYREHPVLFSCRQEASKRGKFAVMQVAPEQGAFLSMLVKLIGADKVLEVGTFTGYSSLSMALALGETGKLVTCDNSEEYMKIASQFWVEAGVSSRIEPCIGNASETLQNLIDSGQNETFDLAFIDADKPSYSNYFEKIFKLVRKGGLIVLDDMLIYGYVATGLGSLNEEEQEYYGPAVESIRELNEKIHNDEHLEAVLIPWRDGITLARKI